MHVDDRKSRIKQYHKEGEALRTETTINDTRDFEAAFQDMQKPGVIADQRAVALRFADPRVRGLLHILLLFTGPRPRKRGGPRKKKPATEPAPPT